MIKEYTPLKPFNTFGIEATARYFTEISTVRELKQILQNEDFIDTPKLFLGGGSNILLMADYPGLVIKNSIKGIKQEDWDADSVAVTAGAGEIWHDFVLYCIENNLSGIENLSLIPGTVGAAPMQNIGAYGAEIKDVFLSLEALNLKTLEIEVFDKEICNFGYRESYFKHEGKGKYVILSMTLKLAKTANINIAYGDIQRILEEKGIVSPSIKDVSDAVIKIRRSKLPDPKDIGNSGSFFKNPEVSKEQFERLKEKFKDLPGYPINENLVKVPAGWLIEQAGWKGKRFGQVGVHEKQALVLVNYGGGTGQEIATLARNIQLSIKDKYGIQINPEVNYI